MRLNEFMSSPVVTIEPDAEASAAWSRMQSERVRHLVVVDGSQVVGLLSDRDLGGRNGAESRRGRIVRELMTSVVESATADITLRQAVNLMRGRLIGSLPVMQGDRLVGIVTATDVLDELGRGSTRPAVTAQRRGMRLPPASARDAARRTNKPGDQTKNVARRKEAMARQTETPALGRDRGRVPDSSKREPMPARLARPAKLESGRAEAGQTPAYIRAVGTHLDRADRDYIRRKLGRKLGKFAESVERASVRIEDVNGPRGGVDKRCRIKVVLSGLPSAVVEQEHYSRQAAIDGALDRIERTVRRSLQRRRMKI